MSNYCPMFENFILYIMYTHTWSTKGATERVVNRLAKAAIQRKEKYCLVQRRDTWLSNNAEHGVNTQSAATIVSSTSRHVVARHFQVTRHSCTQWWSVSPPQALVWDATVIEAPFCISRDANTCYSHLVSVMWRLAYVCMCIAGCGPDLCRRG